MLVQKHDRAKAGAHVLWSLGEWSRGFLSGGPDRFFRIGPVLGLGKRLFVSSGAQGPKQVRVDTKPNVCLWRGAVPFVSDTRAPGAGFLQRVELANDLFDTRRGSGCGPETQHHQRCGVDCQSQPDKIFSRGRAESLASRAQQRAGGRWKGTRPGSRPSSGPWLGRGQSDQSPGGGCGLEICLHESTVTHGTVSPRCRY